MKLLDSLKEYIYAKMSTEEYEKSLKLFDDDMRLLLYICLAYNTSEVLYSEGTMQLITNPNDIFISKVEMSAFLDEFKSLVITVINEEPENDANSNNRTGQKNT